MEKHELKYLQDKLSRYEERMELFGVLYDKAQKELNKVPLEDRDNVWVVTQTTGFNWVDNSKACESSLAFYRREIKNIRRQIREDHFDGWD